ncbi:MAG: response regulator [Nevskia sp.]|nr:response regulator [Nevskia sp.]
MAKTILIIDDAAVVRQALGCLLRDAGYEVSEAVDGQDGLAQLDGRRFNLILCDVNMPRLDGLGFVREAKRIPAYRFTPIVMLTSESEESRREAGQAAGVRAWAVKPFVPESLLGAVAKLALP